MGELGQGDLEPKFVPALIETLRKAGEKV